MWKNSAPNNSEGHGFIRATYNTMVLLPIFDVSPSSPPSHRLNFARTHFHVQTIWFFIILFLLCTTSLECCWSLVYIFSPFPPFSSQEQGCCYGEFKMTWPIVMPWYFLVDLEPYWCGVYWRASQCISGKMGQALTEGFW